MNENEIFSSTERTNDFLPIISRVGIGNPDAHSSRYNTVTAPTSVLADDALLLQGANYLMKLSKGWGEARSEPSFCLGKYVCTYGLRGTSPSTAKPSGV